jgi:hypothetical protein
MADGKSRVITESAEDIEDYVAVARRVVVE